jgi:hypothetical protein
MDLRRLRAVALGLPLLAALACERPTGPELLERTERISRAVHDDPAAVGRLWGMLGVPEGHPWLPELGWVRLTVDGRGREYRGFVVEMVAVPMDPNDGYPCPRVRRMLLAAEEGRRGFSIQGADFAQPIGPWTWCPGSETPAGMHFWQPPVWPTVTFHDGPVPQWNDRDAEPFLSGLSGEARIDALPGVAGECEFMKHPLHGVGQQTRVECELAEYEVSADVVLGVVGDGPTSYDVSPTTAPEVIGDRRVRLAVPVQRVPGARLTYYCDDKVNVGGCKPLVP